MERIEDRSKALSYIGIEVADALKVIPKPVEPAEEENIVEQEVQPKQTISQVLQVEENKQEKNQIQEYQESVTFDEKPTIWQKIKNSKLGRAVSYIFKIRIRIELPNALPEGRNQD